MGLNTKSLALLLDALDPLVTQLVDVPLDGEVGADPILDGALEQTNHFAGTPVSYTPLDVYKRPAML